MSILAGILGLTIYLDDIVVHGPTPEVHDTQLHRVMEAVAKHHLKFNGEKRVFAALAIEYVGFHLLAKGISPLLPMSPPSWA